MHHAILSTQTHLVSVSGRWHPSQDVFKKNTKPRRSYQLLRDWEFSDVTTSESYVSRGITARQMTLHGITITAAVAKPLDDELVEVRTCLFVCVRRLCSRLGAGLQSRQALS